VSDAGLEHLKALKGLTDLNLIGTRVTDAGLEHLKELKALGNLNVPEDGRVTAKGWRNSRRRCQRAGSSTTAAPIEAIDVDRRPRRG